VASGLPRGLIKGLPNVVVGRLEESPRHLLRYVSGFLFELVAGHGWVIPGAGRDGDGENLVTDAANDLLPIGLAFGVRGARHCLIPNSLQRRRLATAVGLVACHSLVWILYLLHRDAKLTRCCGVVVDETAGCSAALGECGHGSAFAASKNSGGGGHIEPGATHVRLAEGGQGSQKHRQS
jgi:hypothetical protein